MTSRHIKTVLVSSVISLTGLGVMSLYVSGNGFHGHAFAATLTGGMSFSNAFCFFLSGIVFYFIVKVMDGEIAVAQIVLPITSLMMVVFEVLHLVVMTLGGTYAQMRESLSIELYDVLDQIILVHPSLESIFNFILISAACLLAMVRGRSLEKDCSYIGRGILCVTMIAVLNKVLHLSYGGGLAHRSMDWASVLLFIVWGAGITSACRSK